MDDVVDFGGYVWGRNHLNTMWNVKEKSEASNVAILLNKIRCCEIESITGKNPATN